MKKYRIKIVNDRFYPQQRIFLFWKYFKIVDRKGTEICQTTIYTDLYFDSEDKCIEFINSQKVSYKYL